MLYTVMSIQDGRPSAEVHFTVVTPDSKPVIVLMDIVTSNLRVLEFFMNQLARGNQDTGENSGNIYNVIKTKFGKSIDDLEIADPDLIEFIKEYYSKVPLLDVELRRDGVCTWACSYSLNNN